MSPLFSLKIVVPETKTFAPASSTSLKFDKFILDNGLTVVVHEDRKVPMVAVNVWYHVGSKNEVEGKTGFAHLFEHLMFNGTENYNNEFFEPFEKVINTVNFSRQLFGKKPDGKYIENLLKKLKY